MRCGTGCGWGCLVMSEQLYGYIYISWNTSFFIRGSWSWEDSLNPGWRLMHPWWHVLVQFELHSERTGCYSTKMFCGGTVWNAEFRELMRTGCSNYCSQGCPLPSLTSHPFCCIGAWIRSGSVFCVIPAASSMNKERSLVKSIPTSVLSNKRLMSLLHDNPPIGCKIEWGN